MSGTTPKPSTAQSVPERAEARLHLVGDVHRLVSVAERADARQVSGRRRGEAVGRGNRLEDHPRDISALKKSLDRRELAERNRLEVRRVREEVAGRGVLARCARQARPPVVAGVESDDLAPAGGMPGGLDRDVVGFAPARGEDRVGQVAGGEPRQLAAELRPCRAGEVVVADVELGDRLRGRGHELGVAMAEIERSAVQMQVEQLAPVEVPEPVALATPDDQLRAECLPGLDPVRRDEPAREFQDLGSVH